MIYQKPAFIIIYILIFLLFLFIAYAIYLYLNQSKYVYHPTTSISTTPSDYGLFFEDLILETSDGIKISAWYIPLKNSKTTILFFHGNGGNISYQIGFIKIFYSLNLSALLIDYRGYGKSEGTPNEEGTYLDSEAAWDYLVKKKNISPFRSGIRPWFWLFR